MKKREDVLRYPRQYFASSDESGKRRFKWISLLLWRPNATAANSACNLQFSVDTEVESHGIPPFLFPPVNGTVPHNPSRTNFAELFAKPKIRPPLASDVNIKKRIAEKDYDFVVASSVLDTIASTISGSFRDDWEIPFEVSEGSKSVIYMEKPLLRKTMSNREKNEKFYKTSLLAVSEHRAIREKAKIDGTGGKGFPFVFLCDFADNVNYTSVLLNSSSSVDEGSLSLLVRFGLDGRGRDGEYISIRPKLEYSSKNFEIVRLLHCDWISQR